MKWFAAFATLFFATSALAILPPSDQTLTPDIPSGMVPVHVLELYQRAKDIRPEDLRPLICPKIFGLVPEVYRVYFGRDMIVLEMINAQRSIAYPIDLSGLVKIDAIDLKLSPFGRALLTKEVADKLETNMLGQARENPARVQNWLAETIEKIIVPCITIKQ